jgi:hypothetical protein
MSMPAHAPRRWPVAARRLLGVGALLAFGALAACSGEAPSDEAAAPPSAPAAPSSASASAPEAAPGAAVLIGQRVPPYPEGMIEISGICVPAAGAADVCAYGLATIGAPGVDGGAATARFLIASRNTEPRADTPVWQVMDALDLPAIEPGDDFQLVGCRLDGKDDGGIVAVMRYGAGGSPASPRWVRRFDVDAGKLVEIEPARVACEDPAEGV